MSHLHDFDPRRAEILDVRYRMVLKVLAASYRNRSHTLRWAALVFVVIWLALWPAREVGADSLYSALAALFWAMVHNVRTV